MNQFLLKMNQFLLKIKQNCILLNIQRLTKRTNPNLGVMFSFTYKEWDLKGQAW
jgi:hypothetical protein